MSTSHVAIGSFFRFSYGKWNANRLTNKLWFGRWNSYWTLLRPRPGTCPVLPAIEWTCCPFLKEKRFGHTLYLLKSFSSDQRNGFCFKTCAFHMHPEWSQKTLNRPKILPLFLRHPHQPLPNFCHLVDRDGSGTVTSSFSKPVPLFIWQKQATKKLRFYKSRLFSH